MVRTLTLSIPVALCSPYIMVLLQATAASANSWHVTHWCKCICFSNFTILPLTWADKPSQPCLTCTKQWCLDQELEICRGAVLELPDPDTATGKEGDVEARCFERDSPRDQLVVTVFLIIVFGLLVGAAVKGRMDRANISLNWNTGTRRWWEALLPSRQQTPYSSSNVNGHRRRTGGYIDLDSGDPTAL